MCIIRICSKNKKSCIVIIKFTNLLLIVHYIFAYRIKQISEFFLKKPIYFLCIFWTQFFFFFNLFIYLFLAVLGLRLCEGFL